MNRFFLCFQFADNVLFIKIKIVFGDLRYMALNALYYYSVYIQ